MTLCVCTAAIHQGTSAKCVDYDHGSDVDALSYDRLLTDLCNHVWKTHTPSADRTCSPINSLCNNLSGSQRSHSLFPDAGVIAKYYANYLHKLVDDRNIRMRNITFESMPYL